MADRNLSTYFRGGRFGTREGMIIEIPPSGFDWLSAGGIPAVVDPWTTGATQTFPLGTKLIYGDRVFRYMKMGATAGVVGKTYQSVVPLAGHIDEVIAAAAVGDKTITFTPNTLTTDDLAANELQDGYIHIISGTGLGHAYKIKSHPAILGASAGVLTLLDPIRITTAATAKATVTHNKFRAVIVVPTSVTAELVGVSIMINAANDFGWLQTKGPCAVLADGTWIVGANVMPSDAVIGAVEHWVPETDTANEVESMGPLGKVIAVPSNTEYGIVDLMLEQEIIEAWRL